MSEQRSPLSPKASVLEYEAAEMRAGRISPSLMRALSSIIGPSIGLLVVIAIFGIWKPRLFLTSGNLINVLSNNYHFAVVAVGMTFVVVTAGIDLSVGSTMALSSVCCAMAIRGVQFPPREAGATIGIGAVIALLVGLCVAGKRMQAGRPLGRALGAGMIAGGASGVFTAMIWLALGGHQFGSAPAVVAVMVGIATGALAGLMNGALITSLGLPPFIVTLATLSVFRGLVLDVTDGMAVSSAEGWSAAAMASVGHLKWLRFGSMLGFPPAVWLAALVVLIGAVVLHFTVVGRYAYAIGSNERTARLCGVKVDRYKMICYIIGGATAGLAGAMATANFAGGQPSEFNGAELTVIAAVVIGGTSLFGGEGTIVGSVLGILMIGLLYSGCVIADISTFKQMEFIGGTILLAAALDRFRHMRR